MFISYTLRSDQQTKKNVEKLVRQLETKTLKNRDYCKRIVSARYREQNLKMFKKSLRLLLNNLILSIKLKQNLVVSLNNNILAQQGLVHKIYVESINILIMQGYITADIGRKGKRTTLSVTESFKDFIIDNVFSIIAVDKDGYMDAVLVDLRTMNSCKPNEYIRASFAVHNKYYYQNILLDYTEQGLKDLCFWNINRKNYIIGNSVKIKVEKSTVISVKF